MVGVCMEHKVISQSELYVYQIDLTDTEKKPILKIMFCCVSAHMHVCLTALAGSLTFPCPAHLVITLNHIPLPPHILLLSVVQRTYMSILGPVDEKLVCAWGINEIWCGLMHALSSRYYIESRSSHSLVLTVSAPDSS